MNVLKRIKRGEKVMVTLPSGRGKHNQYTLTDGTEVGHDQFAAIRAFLTPEDTGLLSDAEPQSYVWAG
ncbi:hypothetical protein [uncultured Ruegeria sp.]|uniref:hypothetical protein n=1 Tax=uncultured Ruegeria sp. TaxID=259304 RepID=UPI00260CD22E|nr:hypothetical protein [uncultured Ruegeria sp.]